MTNTKNPVHISGVAQPKLGSKKKMQASTLPKWLKAISEGSHGSGTYQKRLWKVVSDCVRIRDWHEHGGKCMATGKYISHWKEGQAGHFRPYTKCNGMMKFDMRNIFLQSAQSNGFGDYDDWKAFERNIIERYGEEHLPSFLKENQNRMNEKMYDSDVLLEIEKVLEIIGGLPEQPEYYERVMRLKYDV